MCGFLGKFSWRGRAGVDPRYVARLRHRGPDEAAYWSDGGFFLGHCRLSIIDLSSGLQPMASEDGSLVVVFNGEIYNHIELRDELETHGCRFRTHSDTEVLLHGYRVWGTDLPRHLLGMFAFAIADRGTNELFLGRDRFGEKPLMIVDRDDWVAFASELGALAALPEVPLEVDLDALGDYLCLNYVPRQATLLKAVRRLAPATWRRYRSDGSVEEHVYWRPSQARVVPSFPMTLEQASERFEELLYRSVQFALRSDVPVGIFLSGGIDSTLVAHLAARIGHLSRGFCLSIPGPGFDEAGAAGDTARKLGIPLESVPLEENCMRHFLDVVRHADDPLADSSALAVFTLARAASRTVKVVLGGDGGDELFGGYLTYQATMLHQQIVSRLPMAMRRALSAFAPCIPTWESKVSLSYALFRFLRACDLPSGQAHFSWNGSWLPRDAAKLLCTRDARRAACDSLSHLASDFGLGGRVSLRALQVADINGYLANDILVKADRMTMAHGLEIRSPFLDPELAQFGLDLPDKFKADTRGPLKRILRHRAHLLAGKRLASAKKRGFSIPVHGWLRASGRNLVEDLLAESSIAATGCLDTAQVRRAMQDHMTGRQSLGFELWGLMVFVAWYRARVEHRPPPAAEIPRRLEYVQRKWGLR